MTKNALYISLTLTILLGIGAYLHYSHSQQNTSRPLLEIGTPEGLAINSNTSSESDLKTKPEKEPLSTPETNTSSRLYAYIEVHYLNDSISGRERMVFLSPLKVYANQHISLGKEAAVYPGICALQPMYMYKVSLSYNPNDNSYTCTSSIPLKSESFVGRIINDTSRSDGTFISEISVSDSEKLLIDTTTCREPRGVLRTFGTFIDPKSDERICYTASALNDGF